MEDLTVVIQAGGESRRMGCSKATVPFLGAPLIRRCIKRLQPFSNELIITTNEPENLSFLDSMVSSGELRLERDVIDRRGALTGLFTALSVATKPYVAVVACDMIFASGPLAEAERDFLEQSGADVAVPLTSHGFEPFHAVYRRETCLPLIEAALKSGETRATSWYDQAKVFTLSSDMVHAADPRGGSFINVNTPDELDAMERRILENRITKADEG